MIVAACLSITPAVAHHSIAKFDGSRVVRAGGEVTSFRWINPHVWFELRDEQGLKWVVEMQAPSTMMVGGWSSQSLRAGDAITVFAHPLRQEDPLASARRILYAGIILADGKVLGCVQEAGCRGEQ